MYAYTHARTIYRGNINGNIQGLKNIFNAKNVILMRFLKKSEKNLKFFKNNA